MIRTSFRSKQPVWRISKKPPRPVDSPQLSWPRRVQYADVVVNHLRLGLARRRATAAIATLALLAIAGGIAAGFAGTPRGKSFDWTIAGAVGTALGTILLAVHTAVLATETRAEVRLAVDDQRS